MKTLLKSLRYFNAKSRVSDIPSLRNFMRPKLGPQ